MGQAIWGQHVVTVVIGRTGTGVITVRGLGLQRHFTNKLRFTKRLAFVLGTRVVVFARTNRDRSGFGHALVVHTNQIAIACVTVFPLVAVTVCSARTVG